MVDSKGERLWNPLCSGVQGPIVPWLSHLDSQQDLPPTLVTTLGPLLRASSQSLSDQMQVSATAHVAILPWGLAG